MILVVVNQWLLTSKIMAVHWLEVMWVMGEIVATAPEQSCANDDGGSGWFNLLMVVSIQRRSYRFEYGKDILAKKFQNIIHHSPT